MVGDAAQEDEGMAHIEQEVVTEQEAAELMAADEGAGDVRGAMVVPSDEVPTETSQEAEKLDLKCETCGPPDGFEGRRPHLPADPGRPTQREIDEHNVSHTPYRSWCPHCVKGQAVSSPHRGRSHREESLKVTGIPTVSFDYCWADDNDDEDGARDRGDQSPVLIMYVDLTDSLFAIPTKRKGVVQWVVTYVVKKLETLGYGGTKITVKSDGEVSIVALMSAIAVGRRAETAIIQTPKRESKCNGSVERAVRTWRGKLITLKCHMETELKIELGHKAAVVEWMVMWAAEVRNYFLVHPNGRTSYEMTTAHRFPATTAMFGEKVMYMITPKKQGKNKWKEDWHEGVFLGVQGRTAEVILGNEAGIHRARSIRRLPEDSRWDAELVNKVNIGVAQHVTGEDQKPAEVVVVKPDVDAPAPPVAREFQPRGLKLNKNDFIEHGYSGGCPGCLHYQTGIGARAGHSAECRRRMEDCLAQTPGGKKRVEATKMKMDEHTARVGEKLMESENKDGEDKKNEDAKTGPTEESMKDADNIEDNMELEFDTLEDRPHGHSEARGQAEDDYEPTEPGDILPDDVLGRQPVARTDVRIEIPREPAVKRKAEDEAPDDVFGRHGRLGFLGKIEAPLKIMSVGGKVKGESDIMEVFSPERIGIKAGDHGIVQGSAFDLQNGWDLNDKKQQKEVERQIELEKPTLLIGSPPCVRFSILMNLLMSKDISPERRSKFHEELDEAIEQLRFCFRLYRKQIKAGRYFLHEHPATASSWEIHEVQELIKEPDVFAVVAHMCALGMTTRMPENPDKEVPVMKPTRFLTNSWCVLQALSRRCECVEKHGDLLCGRARAAQEYPDKLCHLVCEAVAEQIVQDKWNTVKTASMKPEGVISFINQLLPGSLTNVKNHYEGNPEHWRDVYHEEDGQGRSRGEQDGEGQKLLKQHLQTLYETDKGLRAWDDPNKCDLDPKKVIAARITEMEFFRKRGVYRKVLRSSVKGKIIKLKWIDTNKGDYDNPNYRSRLVGMEFSSGAEPENYAATPPIEGLRVVVSHAATKRGCVRHKVMINDVARAYFNAKLDRDLYVELPPEDQEPGKDLVGKLELCLYGIQDAARCWQNLLAGHLKAIGFQRGVGHPSVFFHKDWDLKTVVHGDDYATAGPKEGLVKLRKALEEAFDIRETHVIGHEDGDEKEGKVLNRILRAGEHGWELEADPRHAELLIQQLELEGCKGVSSPGTESSDAEEEDNAELTDKEEITKFRGVAARTNYLAQDRPDIAYAAKEVCRDMARPTRRSWIKAKRIVRYLVKRPRLINYFDFQQDVRELTVYADANWAGCKVTRKSTSGGCVLRGTHMLRSWSKTQASIAQSSAESELFGAVRGGVEALGAQTLLRDLGIDCEAKLVLDASAALGILQRQGVGRVRHLDVGALWLQEKEAQRKIKLGKVKGEKNPADLGTKHLSEEVLCRHLKAMSMDFAEGRADAASKLLCGLEQTRRPKVPRAWWDFGRRGSGALQVEKGSLSKLYKGARALRGAEDHLRQGVKWEDVVRYRALDKSNGEVIMDIDVTDVAMDDPRLHTKLHRPVDLSVVLLLKANDPGDAVPSEEGSLTEPRSRPRDACEPLLPSVEPSEWNRDSFTFLNKPKNNSREVLGLRCQPLSFQRVFEAEALHLCDGSSYHRKGC